MKVQVDGVLAHYVDGHWESDDKSLEKRLRDREAQRREYDLTSGLPVESEHLVLRSLEGLGVITVLEIQDVPPCEPDRTYNRFVARQDEIVIWDPDGRVVHGAELLARIEAARAKGR